MDKRVEHRHEIRTFYESVVIRNVPIIKVTKEFLPKSMSFNKGDRSPSPGRRGRERGR